MRRTRSTITLMVLSVVVAFAAPAASADQGPSEHAYRLSRGATAPTYSFADAIRETVWVDLGEAVGRPGRLDLDRDGHPDRVAADIIRPREAAQRGLRVPVLMDVSPYYECCGRGNETQKKTYDPSGRPVQFPLYYDNYFVPRGYGVVLVDVAGTARSTGCDDDGGPVEIGSGTAVVHWLNGHNHGYTAPVGGREVRDPRWTTGDVGVIGKSNDGLDAIGVGVSGDRHVKTVVPIAGLGSLYTFDNPQGSWSGYHLVDPADPPPDPGTPGAKCYPYLQRLEAQRGTSGDFTRYWRQREFNARVHPGHPPVLAVQGWQDRNVDPIQFGKYWQALQRAHVLRHAWLHTGGHLDPFDLQRAAWVRILHRWLDRWLWGINNGVEDEAPIHREVAPDRYVDEQRWPAAGRVATWRPAPTRTPGVGRLVLGGRGGGRETFTDDPTLSADDSWPVEPDRSRPYRVALRSDPLRRDVRVSGSGRVTVAAAANATTARVGVELVDYGPARIRHAVFPAQGTVNLATRSCWGQSRPGDSACFLDTAPDLTNVDRQVLARGVADLGHARSLRHGRPLAPGRYYSVDIELSAVDHVLPAGHRLALLVGGTDAFNFYPPDDDTPRPTVTVDLGRSALRLPVARHAG